MSKTLGYPMGFKEYQRLFRQGHSVRNMGFRVPPPEINRFAHRLRMARSFDGIHLEGYADKTQIGYEGLFKVFLSHSALERFLPLLFGKETSKSRHHLGRLVPLLSSYKQEPVLDVFRTNDPKRAFWNFFYEKCFESSQKHLDRCISGEEVNVFYISAAIRHIFAHGHLTPGVNRVRPGNVRLICDNLSGFLFEFMDLEFCKRIRGYCEASKISFDELGA